MIEKNDVVLAGVSGGPDSISLLYILHKLKDKLAFELYVAHLNHLLRKKAIKEERYVKNICNELGVPITIEKKKVTKMKGESLESSARRIRYDFFKEVACKIGANKVALAHQQDDNIETILMWILRGAGSVGASGISPVVKFRDLTIIRPLIEQPKKNIYSYLKVIKRRPKIDRSNFQIKYTRNKIRLKLIPYMERFNPRVRNNILKLAYILRAENDFMDYYTNRYLKFFRIEKDGVKIPLSRILNLHIAIKRRLIRMAIQIVAGTLHNISIEHIDEILDLLNVKRPVYINLPNGLMITIRYGIIEVSIIKKKEGKCKTINTKYLVSFNKKTEIKDFKIVVKLNTVDKIIGGGVCFDLKKIKPPLFIRSRKNGDKIGNKKLKKLFIDKKIPRENRNFIPIVVDSSDNVIMVGNVAVNKKYLANKDSKYLFTIELQKTS